MFCIIYINCANNFPTYNLFKINKWWYIVLKHEYHTIGSTVHKMQKNLPLLKTIQKRYNIHIYIYIRMISVCGWSLQLMMFTYYVGILTNAEWNCVVSILIIAWITTCVLKFTRSHIQLCLKRVYTFCTYIGI